MKPKLTAPTVEGRIRERRKALGLTQAEAAARAGWKQGTWSDIENGRFSLIMRTMEKVAAALECEIKELIP